MPDVEVSTSESQRAYESYCAFCRNLGLEPGDALLYDNITGSILPWIPNTDNN